MLNEFQRITDHLTENLPNTHCYLDDVSIVTVGSAEEHRKLVINVLKTLDHEGLAINWEKYKLGESWLREYDKFHWKRYSEDSVKRMGWQGSIIVYH